MPDLESLLGAIGAAPALPGALCRNRSRIFDEHQANDPDRERDQHRAQHLCSQCESLAACGSWLAALDPADRPPGVCAGLVVVAAPKRERPKPKPPVVSAMRRRAELAIAEWEKRTQR